MLLKEIVGLGLTEILGLGDVDGLLLKDGVGLKSRKLGLGTGIVEILYALLGIRIIKRDVFGN